MPKTKLNALGAVALLATILAPHPALAQYDAVVGTWDMITEFQGQEIPAVMTLSIEDGELTGVWSAMDQEMTMTDLELEGNVLTFRRTMGQGGQGLAFEGTVDGATITGAYSAMGNELKCTGKRRET